MAGESKFKITKKRKQPIRQIKTFQSMEILYYYFRCFSVLPLSFYSAIANAHKMFQVEFIDIHFLKDELDRLL